MQEYEAGQSESQRPKATKLAQAEVGVPAARIFGRAVVNASAVSAPSVMAA